MTNRYIEDIEDVKIDLSNQLTDTTKSIKNVKRYLDGKLAEEVKNINNQLGE